MTYHLTCTVMITYNSIASDIVSDFIFSDGSYYLSISNAKVNCPLHVLRIMLILNIVAIYKDWSVNKKIFETYRSSKTGNPTIDPLNEVPEDQLDKEQCLADFIFCQFSNGFLC